MDDKYNVDDRSDNVDKLQNMVKNTIQNIEKSEETIAASSSEAAIQNIRNKNKRRGESIDKMKKEIIDEYNSNSLK